MANKFLTVFQNLDKAISGNWDANVQNTQQHTNSYNMTSPNILYKTDDKNDYEKTKLELQQNNYLNNRWKKANTDLSVTAFSGLNNVKLMYRDADLMDSFPEIGAALDIVSEESCVLSPKGQVVNVFSKSDRIKNIIEDLLVNRLDLQILAPMVIRGMCKYGNQFMLLNIDNKLGVTGWRQLPVFEVERIENGIRNPYGSTIGMVNSTDDADLSTKFVWSGEQQSTIPFRNWQIGHFRLLTDSIYLPYGCLVGDTRIETEYGYKEIKNVVEGDKVWTFDIDKQEKVLGEVTMTMYKGVKNTYEVRTKHNYIVGTDDHKLLTYNGEKLEYKEIKELKIDDLLIIDNEINKKSKIIKIDKSPLTENEANFNKTLVWWKDIKYVPDVVDEKFAKFFGFMIGDGWITSGKYIYFATGEYDKFNKEFSDYLEEITNHKVKYLKPYSPENNNYEFSQVICCCKALATIMKRMGFLGKFDTKRIPYWVFESDNKIKKAFLDGLMIADGSFNIDKYDCLRCCIEMSNEQLIKDIKILCQSLGYKTGKIMHRNRFNSSVLKNGYIISSKSTSYYFYYYESFNKQERKYDLQYRKKEGFKTEKIISIEENVKQETYDITVNNKNENFYANGIVTHNCSYLNKARRHWRMLSLMEDMMLIYRLERSIERRVYKIFVGAIDDADVQAYVEEIANNFKRTPIVDPLTGQIDLRKNLLSIDTDIFIPVRDPNASTPIDTLPAAQNLTAMDDIKFIQNKVLTALRIPKTFLNFEETTGDGKNLALMDIRFTRTINRIQQAFLMELTKIVSIHLYLMGFDDELTNFSLSMNNPSTQSEQLEIDNLQKKILAVRDAVTDPGNGIPIMSQTRALREIMKWSDKEIKDNLEEIRLEKGIAAELEKTSQIIKKTGVFDIVDRMYGETGAEYQDDQTSPQDGGDGGMSGGGGGGGFGGGLDDMGGIDDDSLDGDVSGEEGEMPTEDLGNEDNGDTTTQPEMKEPSNENKKYKKPLLTEVKQKSSQPHQNDFFIKQYLNHIDKKEKKKDIVERTDIVDKTLLINEDFNNIIKSIDTFLD